MVATRNTFRKHERLTLKREIDELFTPGSKSFAAYPIRAVCRLAAFNASDVKVLMSVSKRHFHHAVDRNRAKRQMREAYRTNKAIITGAVNSLNAAGERRSLNVAFIWLSDEPQDSALVERKIKNLLHRMAESLPQNAGDAPD